MLLILVLISITLLFKYYFNKYVLCYINKLKKQIELIYKQIINKLPIRIYNKKTKNKNLIN